MMNVKISFYKTTLALTTPFIINVWSYLKTGEGFHGCSILLWYTNNEKKKRGKQHEIFLLVVFAVGF